MPRRSESVTSMQQAAEGLAPSSEPLRGLGLITTNVILQKLYSIRCSAIQTQSISGDGGPSTADYPGWGMRRAGLSRMEKPGAVAGLLVSETITGFPLEKLTTSSWPPIEPEKTPSPLMGRKVGKHSFARRICPKDRSETGSLYGAFPCKAHTW